MGKLLELLLRDKLNRCNHYFNKITSGEKVEEEYIRKMIKAFEDIEDYEKCQFLVDYLRNRQ